MSFFELDGGAKKRKSTKPKATKKAPAKKSSGKKKTKKGGNFLGTVSELFAPAGWENFVTAAGLLALDRTDNYIRKSKDSKKQRGGADDATTPKTDTTPKMEEMESFTSRMSGGARKRSSSRKHRGGTDDDTPKMEEEMRGGARKRSSSRKQRGGSDGHHTVEYLDAVSNEDEKNHPTDTTSQTGGGKKRSKSKSKPKPKSKGKVRKHKGGELEGVNSSSQNQIGVSQTGVIQPPVQEVNNSLSQNQQIPNPRNQLQRNYNNALLSGNQIRINDTKRALNAHNAKQASRQQLEGQSLETSSNGLGNTGVSNTGVSNTGVSNTGVGSLFQEGGKPKSKSKSKSKAKSSTKKPKAKKTKGRK